MCIINAFNTNMIKSKVECNKSEKDIGIVRKGILLVNLHSLNISKLKKQSETKKSDLIIIIKPAKISQYGH